MNKMTKHSCKILIASLGLLAFFSVNAEQSCNEYILDNVPLDRYEINKSVGTVKDVKTGLEWMRCTAGQAHDGNSNVGLGACYYADSILLPQKVYRKKWNEAVTFTQLANDGYTVTSTVTITIVVAGVNVDTETVTVTQIPPFAGHSDWRIPNIKELYSLTSSQCTSPATNTIAFPDMPEELDTQCYWSSTADRYDSPILPYYKVVNMRNALITSFTANNAIAEGNTATSVDGCYLRLVRDAN